MMQFSFGRQDDRESASNLVGRWPAGWDIAPPSTQAISNVDVNTIPMGNLDASTRPSANSEGDGSNEDHSSFHGYRPSGNVGSHHGSATTAVGLDDLITREVAMRIPDLEAKVVSAVERVIDRKFSEENFVARAPACGGLSEAMARSQPDRRRVVGSNRDTDQMV